MPAVLFCVVLGFLLGFEEAGAFMLPGDISLIAGGVRAKADISTWLLLPMWGVATLAMVGGASLLFHTVGRYGRLQRVLPACIRRMIHHHGIWGVAVARLLPGMRNATVFVAASSDMPCRTFLLGLIPAAAVWSGLLLLVGWFGGSAVVETYGRLHHSGALRAGSMLLLGGAAAFVLYRLLQSRTHDAEHGHRPNGRRIHAKEQGSASG